MNAMDPAEDEAQRRRPDATHVPRGARLDARTPLAEGLRRHAACLPTRPAAPREVAA